MIKALLIIGVAFLTTCFFSVVVLAILGWEFFDEILGTPGKGRGTITNRWFRPSHETYVFTGKMPPMPATIPGAYCVLVEVEGRSVLTEVYGDFYEKAAPGMEVEVIFSRSRLTDSIYITKIDGAKVIKSELTIPAK